MMKVPKLSSLIKDERDQMALDQGLCPTCGFRLQQHYWQPQANGGVHYICPDEDTVAFLNRREQELKWTE